MRALNGGWVTNFLSPNMKCRLPSDTFVTACFEPLLWCCKSSINCFFIYPIRCSSFCFWSRAGVSADTPVRIHVSLFGVAADGASRGIISANGDSTITKLACEFMNSWLYAWRGSNRPGTELEVLECWQHEAIVVLYLSASVCYLVIGSLRLFSIPAKTYRCEAIPTSCRTLSINKFDRNP